MKKLISLVCAVLIAMSVLSLPLSVSAYDVTASATAENNDNVEVDSDSVNTIPSDTNGSESQESSVVPDSTESSEAPIATEPSATDPSESSSTESVAPSSTEFSEPDASEATEPSSTEATESVPTEDTTPTETVPAPKKPKKVEEFTVCEITVNSISLRWRKSKDATGYILYRAVEDKNAKEPFTYKKYKTFNDADRTSFTDKKLKSGLVYKYKIAAQNKVGNKTATGKTAVLAAVVCPKATSKLWVSSTTTTEALIKWKAVENAKYYMVFRKIEGGKDFKLIDESVKALSYKDKNLKPGYVYTYKLIAGRKYNNAYYYGVEKTVKAVTKLAQPKNIDVTSSTTSKVTIKWSGVAKAQKYEVYRKAESAKEYTLLAVTKSKSYTDKKVVGGNNYTYRVRGIRTVDGKVKVGIFNSVNTPAGLETVTGVKVKSQAGKGVITWNATSKADGYDIFLRKSDGKDVLKKTTTATSYLTAKHTGGKTYTYVIKSFKKVNNEKVYSAAKVVKVKIVSTAYGKSIGKNYLEVCTETQTVNMYVDGKLYVSTPVVTGYYNVYDTTAGYHYIINKKTPATLRGSAGSDSWEVDVSYWLAFTYDGQGFHDSTWRTSGYGGTIYKYDGSHGCVNTPYSAMGKIFSKAYVGMPVIVY